MPGDGALRLPPQDLDAERATLGAMLLSPGAIDDVASVLSGEEFYITELRELFSIVKRMHASGTPVDLLTLKNELLQLGILHEMGGTDRLVELAESVGSVAHARYYAEIVKQKYKLRQILRMAELVQIDVYNQALDPTEIMGMVQTRVQELAEEQVRCSAAQQVGDVVFAALEEIQRRAEGEIDGIETGYRELDDMLCGLHRGEMIVIGARPSLGKTAFALCLCHHAAVINGKHVLFFSLEMGRDSITERLLCLDGRVNAQLVRRRMFSEDDLRRLQASAQVMSDAQLVIDDSASLSVPQMQAITRMVGRQRPVDMVVIDYLQLVGAARAESRRVQVDAISRELKGMARTLGIPVVVLAQLNRQVVARKSLRPTMSDLREAGGIEQDADVVMLLHREEYYLRDNCPDELRGVAEVIVDKQRNGPTGVVKLFWQAEWMRFENLASQQAQQAEQAMADYQRRQQDAAAEEPQETQSLYEQPSPF